MAQNQRLELRQGQSLVMTAQLQQSIKLLQLSSLELNEYIEQELEKNPFLETEEAGSEQGEQPETAENESGESEGDGERDAVEDLASESREQDSDGWDGQENDTPSAESVETGGFEITDAPRYANTGGGGSLDDDESGLEQTLTREISLRDHLLDQLQMGVADPSKRLIGTHLIDMVDESGYLRDDISPLAEQLGCEEQDIEETIELLQRFDPPGIFARDLKECLSIQLRDRDRFDPAMEALLDHLDLFARGDLERLKKLCGVDAEDLKEMMVEIRALNPKPGLQFEHEITQPIQPDVFIRRLPNGSWQVELNNEVLPRVLVNQRYFAQLSGKTRDKMEKKYLSDHLQTANWLVKALDQRAHTILKVTTEILRQQEGFFRHGVRYLKPLTLKDVASEIGLHESTVSRVTTSKYLSSPRGLHELKYFFTSAIQNAFGGEGISSEAVKHSIKELIDAELPDAILSDDTLAEMLKERGMDIARRTVAKYREALNISSSVERRREKQRKMS